MKKLNFLLLFTLSLVFAIGCKSEGKEVKLKEKGEILISQAWKLQPQETLDASTDSLEDATGIVADIELTGDVGDFADFLAETLVFDRDQKDKSKLAYSSTIGEGFLALEVVGYWEINEDETEITMMEWDSSAGTTKEGVVYKIVEISKDKLVLENKATGGVKIYFPK